jgi:predicted DNA-binding protein
MAMTKRKRIMIILSPDLERTVNRLSKSSGLPVATVARTFLEEAIPSMNALADLFDAETGDELQERYKLMVKRLQGQVKRLPVAPFGQEP